MEQNPWGETEHFEAFKTQPLFPRSPSAILPSEDGVIVSFSSFFPCFIPQAQTRAHPILCKNTRCGIQRNGYYG